MPFTRTEAWLLSAFSVYTQEPKVTSLRKQNFSVVGGLETECRLFPPVTIFLDLFPCAGYCLMLLTDTSEIPKS